MWTRDAARVLRWDGVGTLAPGNHADLIVVDRDPLTLRASRSCRRRACCERCSAARPSSTRARSEGLCPGCGRPREETDLSDTRRQRVTRALEERRRRWAGLRFGLLASSLLLSIGALMIAAPVVHGRVALQIVMYAPLLVGIYVMSDRTRFVVIWGVGLILAVAIGVVAIVRDEPGLLIADVGVRALLLVALMFWIAREMLEEAYVSVDTILGGICLYILIGYLYSLVYLMLLIGDPSSLVIGGQPLGVSLQATHPVHAVPGIFYFSFTAFTTMGFGDITPVTAVARFVTITEGMVGQLFPAIFIARLVSLNLAQDARPPAGR